MHHQLHFKARLYIYLHVPVELNLKHVTSIVWYVRIYTAIHKCINTQLCVTLCLC